MHRQCQHCWRQGHKQITNTDTDWNFALYPRIQISADTNSCIHGCAFQQLTPDTDIADVAPIQTDTHRCRLKNDFSLSKSALCGCRYPPLLKSTDTAIDGCRYPHLEMGTDTWNTDIHWAQISFLGRILILIRGCIPIPLQP